MSEYSELKKDWELALTHILYTFKGCDNKNVNVSPFMLEQKTDLQIHHASHLIISGISGSGKSTFGKALENYGFKKIPSVTTRLPRKGESIDDYIFLDIKTFNQRIKNNQFAFFHKTNDVWHGFLNDYLPLLNDTKGLFYMDKSVHAAKKIMNNLASSHMTLIYLLTPSFSELYRRLVHREQKDGDQGIGAESIVNRLYEEIHELRISVQLPYAYLVNDSIERIVKRCLRLS